MIENFLDSSSFGASNHRPSYDPSDAEHREVDRTCIRVAVVSRVDAFKRIDLLVESTSPKDFPDFHFDVYGTGDQFDRFKALSESTPNLRLHGFVPDVERRLADADLLLHLCPQEPFGLAILEAFRAGLLVLCPTGGGASQLVEEGVTGLRFDADGAGDLARALRTVRDLPSMLLSILFAARRVVGRFGLPRLAIRLQVGFVALVLSVAAELMLAAVLQGAPVAQYVASRDPVSGSAYLVMLTLFSLMPPIVGRRGSVRERRPE